VSALDTQARPATSLKISYDKKLMVFGGRAHPELAAKIADKLGIKPGPVTLKTFSNGEVYCRYDESIRGADVFIVQPTCGNPETGVSANDALMELVLMVDAAVGASAHRVIAVTPWYGYSRQDKKSTGPRADQLPRRGPDARGRRRRPHPHDGPARRPGPGLLPDPGRPHDGAADAVGLLPGPAPADLVVVAPDVGRAKLAEKFREKLGADLAILTKERPAHQVAEIGYIIGDVRDKTALLLDDMIDTAGTLVAAAETVLDSGARSVYAAATHPVLSGRAFENLARVPFEEIVVTDTIPLREGAPSNIRVLSCADLLTDSIRRIFTDDSVSEVFGGENQLF
jgi:ribose-phosphate pyrophosphokinase